MTCKDCLHVDVRDTCKDYKSMLKEKENEIKL